jgi:hypothetical protein
LEVGCIVSLNNRGNIILKELGVGTSALNFFAKGTLYIILCYNILKILKEGDILQTKYLYHYTTIDTLTLILKNKTMRFNSLSNVDDLEEFRAIDLNAIGKYCFVSCWTASEEENVALWQMYSKNGTGVRIKLPSYPFEIYKNPIISFSCYENIYTKLKRYEVIENSETYNSIFEGITLRDGYYLQELSEEEFLIFINYTDDELLIIPQVMSEDGKNIKTSIIGRHKRKAWSFQKECRYRFFAYPLDINETAEYMQDTSIALNKIKDQIELPISYYDLKLDSDKFKDMEVTLGPNTSLSEKIIVQALINNFNPPAKISHSTLEGKIRFK